MTLLQASIRLRTKILKVHMKRSWANFVSTSAFWPICLESQTLSWLWHLLCREISERFQQEKTELVFLRCQRSALKCVSVEQATQIIIHIAHTFMVHVSLHWTDRGSDDISLWPFAVKHSVWVYNRVLNVCSGLTPLELITRERSDYKDLLC